MNKVNQKPKFDARVNFLAQDQSYGVQHGQKVLQIHYLFPKNIDVIDESVHFLETDVFGRITYKSGKQEIVPVDVLKKHAKVEWREFAKNVGFNCYSKN